MADEKDSEYRISPSKEVANSNCRVRPSCHIDAHDPLTFLLVAAPEGLALFRRSVRQNGLVFRRNEPGIPGLNNVLEVGKSAPTRGMIRMWLNQAKRAFAWEQTQQKEDVIGTNH